MDGLIKVGFCVAYDWPLLRYALPAIYDAADSICLSIDVDQRTWAGGHYSFDRAAFDALIKSIDKQGKIKVYADNFYMSELTPAQNEVRQRQKLAEALGQGGWHLQLDSDEYFLNFDGFVKYLKALNPKDLRLNVCCPLVTLFKQVEGGILYIEQKNPKKFEYIQIVTPKPQYLYGRRNGHFNVYTNFLIIHQSWARSEQEVEQKLMNWGHVKDFDPKFFLEMWRKLSRTNYESLKNFHPIEPEVWSTLRLNQSPDIETLIRTFNVKEFQRLSQWQLWLKNSRGLSKLRALLKPVIGWWK